MRSVTLTDDEVNMIAYALREIGNRRQEQSIEARDSRIVDCNVIPKTTTGPDGYDWKAQK